MVNPMPAGVAILIFAILRGRAVYSEMRSLAKTTGDYFRCIPRASDCTFIYANNLSERQNHQEVREKLVPKYLEDVFKSTSVDVDVCFEKLSSCKLSRRRNNRACPSPE